MCASRRVTCSGQDISPLITPRVPQEQERLLDGDTVGATCWDGCWALVRARAAHADGIQSRNALLQMTTKDFPDASWVSVSARSRSRSLGAPFAHPDDRAFGQPIETGAQTCQQIASMGLVRQDPPHHSPQRSSRSGSHDRGAADRSGPFVHPADGKPGSGQLPSVR